MSGSPGKLVSRAALVVGTLAISASVSSCAGGPKASFDGQVFREGPVAFRLGEVPATWRRVDLSGASLAFYDDLLGASALVKVRCKRPDDVTPLVALTHQLVMGSTERDILEQRVEPFDERQALRTIMTSRWDGVLLQQAIVVLKKDGCVYDFVYTAQPSSFPKGLPQFDAFLGRFRTLDGSGVASLAVSPKERR